MAQTILSLYDVSAKLSMSPSAIKKRVASLNLPVARGARGKLLFDEAAYATLCRADELLKAGNGFEACRRQLGLDVALVADRDETVEPAVSEIETPVADRGNVADMTPVAEVGNVAEREVAAEIATPSVPDAEPETQAVTEAETVVAAIAPPVTEPNASTDSEPKGDDLAMQEVVVAAAPVSVGNHGGALPAPVFIQLGRRKPSDSVRIRMVEHQPTPTPMPAASAGPKPTAPAPERVERAEAIAPPTPAPPSTPAQLDPDLITRLDSTLKLIEDKDRQNHMLQSKLLVAYDEMTKLSATAAAFQERSMNLQHEVQKLQSEIRLLTAAPEPKPWWKFWG